MLYYEELHQQLLDEYVESNNKNMIFFYFEKKMN